MKTPLAAAAALLAGSAGAQTVSGPAAYGDWRTDAPGVTRLITPKDLQPLGASRPKAAPAAVAPRPEGAAPKVPPGFAASLFAKLDHPRLIRTAPNGDVFISETDLGRIRVLRAKDGAGAAEVVDLFAEGLDKPFGLAFYPAADPRWLYVANINSVVRIPYRSGDLKARGPAQIIIPKLAGTTNYHTTRDISFSPDGERLFISVGSGSNVAEEIPKKTPEETADWAKSHALGAAWGGEERRADILTADPEGRDLKVYAAGIRNCVGMAVQPERGDLWCAVNERDLLGDDLPPDYVTRVAAGSFFGWPWYYIGDHQDPRANVNAQRPDLAGAVTTPDVLIQPHSAPLQLTFYTAKRGPALFPAPYAGDLYVALHGSWNRAKRTGYKVVRVRLKDGRATGEYEDFATGFVVDDQKVWGRPVGVAVAHDGALLISEDAGGEVWRVAPSAPKS